MFEQRARGGRRLLGYSTVPVSVHNKPDASPWSSSPDLHNCLKQTTPILPFHLESESVLRNLPKYQESRPVPQPRGASAPQRSLTHFLSSSRNPHTQARRQRPTEAPGDVPHKCALASLDRGARTPVTRSVSSPPSSLGSRL